MNATTPNNTTLRISRIRRILSLALAGGLMGAGTFFGTPAALAQDVPVPFAAQDGAYGRTAEQLQQLAAPVALYPDALLAQVLVASSYPDDVMAAAQWLQAGNDPAGIDDQNWDPSVKGIARYPEVLNALASNPDWMNNLGDAFVHQPDDLMAAVQGLRAQANSAGNLVSNEQQQVLCEDNAIEIVPTDPAMLYVPIYDPAVVFVPRRGVYFDDRPLIRFGFGVHVGAWLRHDLDWHDHRVYVGDWGSNRPWWHREGRGFGGSYIDRRPANYGSTRITNVTNINVRNNSRIDNRNRVDNQPVRWQRDGQKPGPRATNTFSRTTPTNLRNNGSMTPTFSRDGQRTRGNGNGNMLSPRPQPTPVTDNRARPQLLPNPNLKPNLESRPQARTLSRTVNTSNAVTSTRTTPTINPQPRVNVNTPSVRATVPTPTVRTNTTPTPTVRTNPTSTVRTNNTPTVRSNPTPSVRSNPTPSVRSNPTPSVRSNPTPAPKPTNTRSLSGPSVQGAPTAPGSRSMPAGRNSDDGNANSRSRR